MEDEFSPGGSKIYRHAAADFRETSDLGESSVEEIDAHITKWLGEPLGVFHELVSPTVHVDVHIVAPGPERDFYALVTSGLSDKPMNGPFPDLQFAELIFLLPADWNSINPILSRKRTTGQYGN
jgi:Suppressor of fused protein (SUFU)